MKRTSGNSQIQYIVVGFIIFFILLSMAPTFYEWNARGRIHADRFFELVHNFPTDYNLYLSRIREGKEGAWLATEKYTSEPHAPSLSQVMYVVIGRLADYAHVQTPYIWFAYHVARVFFGALLLWVIWKTAEWFFSDKGIVPKTEPLWQFIAFLLVVTASTWPKFEVVAGVPRLGGWMGWYTMSDIAKSAPARYCWDDHRKEEHYANFTRTNSGGPRAPRSGPHPSGPRRDECHGDARRYGL